MSSVIPTETTELYRTFDQYRTPLDARGKPFAYWETFQRAIARDNAYVGWSDSFGGFWVITGWEEARQVFRDPKNFTNKTWQIPVLTTPSGRPLMLLGYDAQEHAKYRRLVQPAFNMPSVAGMYDDFLLDARAIIASFADLDRVDLAKDFATKIPHMLFARFTGLPVEEATKFGPWVHAVTHSSGLGEDNSADLLDMNERFDQLLAERRKNPSDDIMSKLVTSGQVDGKDLTYDDLLDYFTVFLVGTIENTALILGDACWLFATRPELRQELKGNPELMEPFVDELLRYFSPSAGSARMVMTDTELGGVTMKAGDSLLVYLPLVDRDTREFDDPFAFDIHRGKNRHFALGNGPHRCLGASIVRVEIIAVLQALLEDMRPFSLDPEQPITWTPGGAAGMTSVPVVFGDR
ncbi:cytochrome P450 [Microbacterium sp.]|uniref:cytochrome P450 n=1 Tax=Microbacterium sp. TaxID=51671 RepID=UPI003A8E114F